MKVSILIATVLFTISAHARTQQAMLCRSGSTIDLAVNQINAALYDVSLYKGTKAKEEGFVRIYSQDSEKHAITYHDLEISNASAPTITKLDGEGFTACVLVTGNTKSLDN